MTAPVCSINPNTPKPSDPLVLTPSIPIANPNNVVAVVNAIRDWINTTQGNNNGGNNSNNQTQFGGFSENKSNSFKVVKQVVKEVKVYDPNDPTKQTFVTVNQIVGLQMKNPVSGEVWNWQAPGDVPG